jgi:peptidoglycan/LPS O-acetylase OafA/YrhL
MKDHIASTSQNERNETFNLGYRPELDGFRGICILLVFIHHLYHSILPGGFLGVDMFFVLSGFLITSILLKEWSYDQNVNLKNFYIRRLCRLMPAVLFLALMLFFITLFLDDYKAEKTFQGIWLTLSYSSNWLYAFDLVSANNPLGVTWSLAIEEQFYFVFPLLLLFVLKIGLRKQIIIFITIFSIIIIALNRKILFDHGASIQRLYYSSDTRADALLIGCLTAFLLVWNLQLIKKLEKQIKAFGLISITFLVYLFSVSNWSDDLFYTYGGYTLVALLVSDLLIVLVAFQPTWAIKILSFSPLLQLGRLSYGLYLWHWTIRYFIYDNQTLPDSNLQISAVIILSLLFAIFSFYIVERPFLKYKELIGHAHNTIKY